MQHSTGVAYADGLHGFSTLYGSKWVATTQERFIARCIQVSVPSTGRSGLQRHSKPLRLRTSSSFSTLYGSKWVATKGTCSRYTIYVTFQYPLRVEVGCNSGRCRGQAFPKRFQYPLRVEVGCNCGYTLMQEKHMQGFSTLYGSKWVATFYVFTLGLTALVSVPSTGRSGLQHPTRASLG